MEENIENGWLHIAAKMNVDILRVKRKVVVGIAASTFFDLFYHLTSCW
jgi:hypothetical protein